MSALNRQVGGDHYKNRGMQPVELWAALDLNAFQGAIVKYITRHKEKNGAADIDKAEHFFELMLALYPVRWWHLLPGRFWWDRRRQKAVVKNVDRYASENRLTSSEAYAIRCALLPALYYDRRITALLFTKYLENIRTENGYTTNG